MSDIIKLANLDDIIRRYQAGESELKLAREFGVSRNVIRRRLVNSGVTPRNSSQANVASMALMPIEQRQARAAAAHAAVKGRKHSIAEKSQRAATVETLQIHISTIENLFADMLRSKGITNITQQKAIGIYNVDIAIERPRIAVEVMGGNWHTSIHHAALHHKRIPFILDKGWSVVIIWVNAMKYPLTIQAADYVVALVEAFRLNKPKRCQYRVIRGTGEDVPVFSSNFNCITPIKRPTT